MKVTPNKSGGFENAKPITTDKGARLNQFENKPVRADTLTINAASKKTELQFVESLKAQILNEVKAGADIHKLDDLKKQVALGEYEVNPADVIHKMMRE